MQNATAGAPLIAFIHSVTGPRAAGVLAPRLSKPDAPSLLRYAWQAAAGIYAGFAVPEAPEPPPSPAAEPADLIEQAIATADEHAIKFVEVCLSEFALQGQAVFLHAAWRACERLR